MATLTSFLGDNSDCFATLGVVAASYIAFKFLCSVWRGVKTYILARSLGIGRTDLKKLGSWAVVTGATDGIGKGYALELARKGLNVILISRSPEKLNDVAQEIMNKYSIQTRVVAVDFGGEANVIYNKIRKELDGVDIGVLVNNVGMSYEHPQYYTEVKDDKVIQNMVNVNIMSMSMVTRIVLPSMVDKKKGAIINIGSGSGLLPTPLLTPYAASKAYVDFFSRGLQSEYKSKGIIIQGVMPFFVATKLSKIRRASLFAPDPVSYARSALTTVGVEDVTFGVWPHAMQAYVTSAVPYWVYEKLTFSLMASARKRALKKAQKKE